MLRRIVVTAAAGVLLGSPLQAQRTADLRYAAPQPVRVAYATSDTMSITTTGGPMPMDMTGHIRSVIELEITEAAGKLSAKGVVKEMSGTMNTGMMGQVPLPTPQGDAATVTVAMTPAGPDTAGMNRSMPDVMAASFAGGAMAKARVGAALVMLPGRTLRMGETWTDTITVNMDTLGLKVASVSVVHGTYVRDSTVNARTMHVLHIRTDMRMTSTGAVQGTNMDQTMEGQTNSEVLWDPTRRVAVAIVLRSDMKMAMAMEAMTMNMLMKNVSVTREITP